ncbi:DUF1223 domain-containing protein [Neptuniibacter sp. QD48_11]|uniref:DUF1223 domain-containing protein n=1 Tax=unclassified Neptuniibacter TaxID=2630693 RepID=UPI0039F47D4B
MKLFTNALIAASLYLLPQNLMAEQIFENQGPVPQLVELYTSEGCSSCPPAERYINSFVNSPDLWKKVVPLAFHVDYWDYIGWKDRFAQPEFKQRQYNHRRLGNFRSVYTPGWISSGKEWRGFFQGKTLPNQSFSGGLLKASLNTQTLKVSYTPTKDRKALIAHVAVLGFDLSSQVTSGENAGRLLQHQFVVLHKQQKAQSDYNWSFELPHLQTSQKHALAIWVSERDQQPIQVAADWLK